MGAPSKRARKIRSASEFDAKRLANALVPPVVAPAVYAWTLEQIMAARDAQIRGQFAQPAMLATSMRTDDALFVARTNRLDPQRCTRVEIIPARQGARETSIAAEAEALYGQDGVAISPGTRADINGCLVDHAVAFAFNVFTPRPDGSRLDVEVRYWPIEHVRWDPTRRCYVTRVDPSTPEDGATMEIPIVHGDGRWIIFSAHDYEPHKQDAALLPASLVWARHAFAIRDWAKGSVAHGSAKVVGEMPEGVPLQTKNDEGEAVLTPEAVAFVELLRALGSSDAPCVIRPAKSKTEFVTNPSTAWEVWNELVLNAEKAAARIYLGTDGVLGAGGGAPGVDIMALFGVAATKVQGDLGAMERGLATGSIEIWTALNFGDSKLAPQRKYMLPDADADAARASVEKRTTAFFAHIKGARDNGFAITQEYVATVAKLYDVEPPTLAMAPSAPAAAPATSPTAAPALRSVQ